MTNPELPEMIDLASIAMRELDRRGGICGVDELRAAVRSQMSAAPESVSRRWERSFSERLGWATVMLIDLEEVARDAPTDEYPSGAFRANSEAEVSSPTATRTRRATWIEDFAQAEFERIHDA